VTGTSSLARSLLRRPAVRVAVGLAPVAGLASGSLPLLDVPGYELAELSALLAALALSPWLGIAAAREARAGPRPSPAVALAAAAAVLAALLALLFAGSALRAALGPCRALAQAAFFPLLALPSALLGAAVAVAAGFAARGSRLLAGALYALFAATSLAGALHAAYIGPAAFLRSALLGLWPGPLYDEVLAVDARVWLGAAEAVGAAVAIAGAAEAAVRLGRPGARALAIVPALALLAGGSAALAARGALAAQAGDGGRAGVERALGAVREGPHCRLVLPAEKPEAAQAALLSDCEFQVADVARALGIAAPPRVTVYVHRSTAEKRWLVGAGQTDFTKPWRAEIHVTDQPLPHPVLRHEVVHAVASAIAEGPLRVPARAGVVVSAGLVEGLAVALEVPRSAWTVHQWSRTARDQGYLPDLTRALGPAGFWSQAPARAYTAAGSFLLFLLERHGPEKIALAYRTGDVAAALGRPLDLLVADWQRFLDGVPVAPGLQAAARARLSRPSLFARPCARDVAAAEAEAWAAAGAGRTAEACARFDQLAARTAAPPALRAKGDALARAGDLDGARAAYREAAARAGEEEVALRSGIAAAEGDLAWRGGDVAAAAAAWSEVIARGPDRGDARLLAAKLAAVADPELAKTALPYLLGLGDPATALARVARVDRPLSAYLVGRAHFARGERVEAARELGRALAGGLPAVLAGEATLLLAEARCASGDRGGIAVLPSRPEDPADADRIAAVRRRCAP
jgi:hypothetical protein